MQCAAGAESHGQFVICVASLTQDLRAAQVITDRQKARIQKCAARVNPYPARHLRIGLREGS